MSIADLESRRSTVGPCKSTARSRHSWLVDGWNTPSATCTTAVTVDRRIYRVVESTSIREGVVTLGEKGVIDGAKGVVDGAKGVIDGTNIMSRRQHWTVTRMAPSQ